MQRGFMITLAASVNSVRERSCGSEMAAKADGGRSSGAVLGVSRAAEVRHRREAPDEVR